MKVYLYKNLPIWQTELNTFSSIIVFKTVCFPFYGAPNWLFKCDSNLQSREFFIASLKSVPVLSSILVGRIFLEIICYPGISALSRLALWLKLLNNYGLRVLSFVLEAACVPTKKAAALILFGLGILLFLFSNFLLYYKTKLYVYFNLRFQFLI